MKINNLDTLAKRATAAAFFTSHPRTTAPLLDELAQAITKFQKEKIEAHNTGIELAASYVIEHTAGGSTYELAAGIRRLKR